MTKMKYVLLVAALVVAGPAKPGHHGSVASSFSWTVVAAAQSDPHPTFTVGTATASRGQKAYGVMHVPAGVDAAYDIPVVVIHGARPGPVLAVVSGAHGTWSTIRRPRRRICPAR